MLLCTVPDMSGTAIISGSASLAKLLEPVMLYGGRYMITLA